MLEAQARSGRFSLVTIACCALSLCSVAIPAAAQNEGDAEQSTTWAAPAIVHAHRMRVFADVDNGSQTAPRIIRSPRISTTVLASSKPTR